MRYLLLRNHIYYFRFKVPARFRNLYPKAEIKSSLYTNSYHVAVSKVNLVLPLIEKLSFN